MTLFNLQINLDRYLSDHTPHFEFDLVLLNVNVIEFSYYFRYHRDEAGRLILPEAELHQSR